MKKAIADYIETVLRPRPTRSFPVAGETGYWPKSPWRNRDRDRIDPGSARWQALALVCVASS